MHFLFGFSSDWWFWVSFHLAYLPFVYCLLSSVGSSLCHKDFVFSSFPESFRFIFVACLGLSFICSVGYGLKGFWGGVDLFCLHVRDQLPQHSLLKRLSPLIVFVHLLKNQLSVLYGSVSGLYFLTLTCVYVFGNTTLSCLL